MNSSSMFLRFPLHYRVEHWILAVNFTILAVTGLSQYFALSPVSQWIIGALGGVENARHIHHIAALILILEALVHIGVVRYREYIRCKPSPITPGWRDLTNALMAFGYNLGFTKQKPKEGRYTFAEKAEYWAVIWGTFMMVLTGFMMWNPVATTRFFPGEVIPAAKVAHGLEAILAVAAIFIWHFYFVLIKHFNPSMFTGYLTKEKMEREHPLELADIISGRTPEPPVDKETQVRFWRFCFPQYIIIASVIFAWCIWFAYYEQTSVEEIVPAENVNIFVPVGESDAAEPVKFDSWENGILDIFLANCSECHDENAQSGLNYINYQSLIDSGVIVPGDPDSSRLIIEMRRGVHPGHLVREELGHVIAWIANGAPRISDEAMPISTVSTEESIEGEEGALETVSSMTWASGIGRIFTSSCGRCHGSLAIGGLNLTSYSTTMAAGVIVSGNPGASKLIREMETGGHPGSLSPANLEAVRAWIAAGAPAGDIQGEPAEETEAEVEEPEVSEEETGTSESEPEDETPEVLRPVSGPPSDIPDYYWDSDVSQVFQAQCVMCHGSTATGGVDFRTYESAMNSDIIEPGSPDDSTLIYKIEVENHPGTLTGDEISMIRAWIWKGALENESSEPFSPSEETSVEKPVAEEPPVEATPAGVPAGYTWTNYVRAIFASCTSCHGSMALGGLDLREYSTAMDAGVFTPGDSAGSVLIQIMEAGGHPGSLTDEQLATVRQWIDSGALE